MKQSPAQSNPRTHPRNVPRDPGLINAVWRELQVNTSTALGLGYWQFWRQRCNADLSGAAASLRDVEAEARSVSEKQARLGDEAEQELSLQQEATRTREEEAHRELLLPSGKYVKAERRRKAKKREYSKS